LPETFQVIEVESGEVVYEGQVKEKEREDAAQKYIGYGDFSEVCEEGSYYLQSSVFGRSYVFEIGDSVYVLYGGSVKPDNVKDYVNDENIDGALVGGASLKAESFLEMINNLLD